MGGILHHMQSNPTGMLAKENLLALRSKIQALSAPGIEMDKPRKTKKRQLEDMYEAALKKQRVAMEEAGEDPAQLMAELEAASKTVQIGGHGQSNITNWPCASAPTVRCGTQASACVSGSSFGWFLSSSR
jgi:hypothetical protein